MASGVGVCDSSYQLPTSMEVVLMMMFSGLYSQEPSLSYSSGMPKPSQSICSKASHSPMSTSLPRARFASSASSQRK